MLRNSLVIFLLLLFANQLQAQFAKTVRTIRPNGRVMGAYTVGKGVWQVQSGLRYADFQDGTGTSLSEAWIHNTVLRVGILENLELSGVVGWRSNRNPIDDPLTGIHNTQLGARYNILDGSKGLALCVQGRILLQAQKEEFQRDKVGSNVQIGLGRRATSWLVLNASVGATWTGNDSFFIPIGLRGLFTFSPQFGAVLEISDLLSQDGDNFRAGGGLYYIVNSNLKVDLYFDPSIRNTLLSEIGFTWRFHNRTNE